MFQYLIRLLLLALEIENVMSAKKIKIAFVAPYCQSLSRIRNGEFISSSSFTYLRGSTDDGSSHDIKASWDIHDDWDELAQQQQDEYNADFLSFFQDPARDVARSIELEAKKKRRNARLFSNVGRG